MAGIDYCRQPGIRRQQRKDKSSMSLEAASYAGYCDSDPVAEEGKPCIFRRHHGNSRTGTMAGSNSPLPACERMSPPFPSTSKQDAVFTFSTATEMVDFSRPAEKRRGAPPLPISGTFDFPPLHRVWRGCASSPGRSLFFPCGNRGRSSKAQQAD